MRINLNILYILFLVAFSLYANNTQCIGDSIGKSVDQLIDESNGIYSHNPNFPESPQESRMIWSKERGINFTMPSKLSKNGTNAKHTGMSSTSEEIQDNTSSNINSEEAPSTQLAQESQMTGITGNWSFRLRDSKNRNMALTLLQSGNSISGTGTINDGGDTKDINASGSIHGDKLNINATSSGAISLYEIVLLTNGSTASGKYRAFAASGETWIGLAEGMRMMAN